MLDHKAVARKLDERSPVSSARGLAASAGLLTLTRAGQQYP